MYDMNEVSTAKRIQAIAALSVEQLEIDLPEGEKRYIEKY
jgi:hypothetical protein